MFEWNSEYFRDLNDKDGRFIKTLTPGQWKAIRKLLGNETGAAIYWYVESSGGLVRYAKTGVMSFVLTDGQ